MREKIEQLLMSTGREGMANLLQYMRTEGFYEAPCSSQYHLACKEGLAMHSLNVYEAMNRMSKSLDAELPENSIKIASLLHDIGKCGQYNKPNYIENILKSGKRSESKPYETNKDLLYIPHEVRSIQIITQFIELTEEEQFAIMYHADVAGDFKYIAASKQRPLQLMLFMADYWCAKVVEV